MGVGVKVDLPGFWATGTRGRATASSAWIQREASFDTAPRFLVSVFLADQPGLLATILRILDDGMDLQIPEGAAYGVRFSVDGSLCSSVHGAFTLVFVIKPVVDLSVRVPEPTFSAAVRAQLKDRIRQTLEESFDLTELHDPEQRVRVFPFQGLDDGLFSERRFTEYRFGVYRGSASVSVKGSALAGVAAAFARVLGAHQVPIAYLYFPDHAEDADEGLAWLRLGIGAPSEPVDSLELDLAADRIAEQFHCRFLKYDATVDTKSMAERFREIADYKDESEDRSVHETEASVTGHAESGRLGSVDVDVVFAEGRARAGYVADMLEDASQPRVLGGSMTVLAGHTVSCWVVPVGEGTRLASHILALDETSSGASEARSFARPLPARAAPARPPGVTLWLAWRSSDEPGVYRGLVDTVIRQASTQDAVTNGLRDTDFRYGISRVLADGVSCAGKMKFTIYGRKREEAENLRATLQEQAVLAIRSILGSRGNQEPAVVVQESEPGEEPWASLLVDA